VNAQITSKIVGIGHAMCDIYAELPQPVWAELKSQRKWQNLSRSIHVSAKEAREILEFLKSEMQRGRISDLTLNAGGSALNAIRVASLFGVKSSFIGCIGNDEEGLSVRKGLAQANVEDRLTVCPEKNSATGIFFTLMPKDSQDEPSLQEKTILASPSSAQKVRQLDVDSLPVMEASLLHTEAILADNPFFIDRIFQKCKEAHIEISIDLANARAVKENRNTLIVSLRRYANFIFCTKAEFEALEEGIHEIAPQAIWIIKKDREGVDCVVGKTTYFAEAPRCRVIDETGAGDAFAGAFLATYFPKKDIPSCLRQGTCAAESVLKAKGSVPAGL